MLWAVIWWAFTSLTLQDRKKSNVFLSACKPVLNTNFPLSLFDVKSMISILTCEENLKNFFLWSLLMYNLLAISAYEFAIQIGFYRKFRHFLGIAKKFSYSTCRLKHMQTTLSGRVQQEATPTTQRVRSSRSS